MPSLLVRDVEPKVLAQLKARAQGHGRSLQAEVKAILEQEAALSDRAAWLDWVSEFSSRAGRKLGPDSTDLVRESRDER